MRILLILLFPISIAMSQSVNYQLGCFTRKNSNMLVQGNFSSYPTLNLNASVIVYGTSSPTQWNLTDTLLSQYGGIWIEYDAIASTLIIRPGQFTYWPDCVCVPSAWTTNWANQCGCGESITLTEVNFTEVSDCPSCVPNITKFQCPGLGYCFGLNSNSPQVCSGSGTCQTDNQCQCDQTQLIYNNETWTRCASEYSTCVPGNSTTGPIQVRYGSAETSEWTYRTMENVDAFLCSNRQFGDPSNGQRKACWTRPADC